MFALAYLVGQALVYAAEVAAVRYARLWPRALDLTRPTAADARANRANHGGVPPNFGTYYIVDFAQAWSSFEKTTTPHSTILVLRFAELSQASVEARVATSFISFDQASRNLALELGGKSVKELRDEAAAHWSSYTDRIEITGGSPRQRQTFSSCFYRRCCSRGSGTSLTTKANHSTSAPIPERLFQASCTRIMATMGAQPGHVVDLGVRAALETVILTHSLTPPHEPIQLLARRRAVIPGTRRRSYRPGPHRT